MTMEQESEFIAWIMENTPLSPRGDELEWLRLAFKAGWNKGESLSHEEATLP